MTTLPEPLSRDGALAYLLQRIDYERALRFPYQDGTMKLDRMRQLLAELGNPHRHYPIVHVAGTKGKGSTSAMIASILSAAGYRTGLYTSPHLEQIEERMSVDGLPCSGSEFAVLIDRVRRIVQALDLQAGDGQGATYFEITTAAAMVHFARRAVDAAVLEVGLGGRLDATNVCQPQVAVITSISFDHMRQLGHTLRAIAGEKAGIIKPGVPVVSGVLDPEPASVIQARAKQQGCVCYQLGRDFCIESPRIEIESDAGEPARDARHLVTRFDYTEPRGTTARCYRALHTGLLGRHQAANAGVAISAVHRLQELGWRVPAEAIRQGLARVYVPARTELVRSRPPVIVDAAHNVASIEALLELLDEAFGEIPRRILVFATSRDKDLDGMLRCLLPQFETVILTRFMNNPRYVEPEELKQLADRIVAEGAGSNRQILVESCPAAAWAAAETLATADSLICSTGSFFLAAEIRSLASRG